MGAESRQEFAPLTDEQLSKQPVDSLAWLMETYAKRALNDDGNAISRLGYYASHLNKQDRLSGVADEMVVDTALSGVVRLLAGDVPNAKPSLGDVVVHKDHEGQLTAIDFLSSPSQTTRKPVTISCNAAKEWQCERK
jgi:hypothetical protein